VKKPERWAFNKLLLGLVPVIFVWAILQLMGVLDWRFQWRGTKHSPVNVWYVDRDVQTSATYGENPFPRQVYADTAEALITLGQAKILFYDFVMSPLTRGYLIDRERLLQDDLALTRVMQTYGNQIILAVAYNGFQQPYDSDSASYLPLKYVKKGQMLQNEIAYDPLTNPFPEAPTYPIWAPSYADQGLFQMGWGKVAMINSDISLSKGAINRWIPLYVELDNEKNARNYLIGHETFEKLQDPNVSLDFIKSGDVSQLLKIHPGITEPEILAMVPSRLPITFYSAGLELLCGYYGLNSEVAVRHPEDGILEIYNPFEDTVLHRIPLVDDQILEINWFGGWKDRQHASMGTVVDKFSMWNDEKTSPEKRAEIEQWFARFKDAVVLIGPVDPMLQDLAPTPFDPAPVAKVGVHGNVFQTLVNDAYLKRLPDWIAFWVIVGVSFLFTLLVLQGGHYSRVSKVLGLGLISGYTFLSFFVFAHYNWILPLVAPLGAAFSSGILGLGIQLFIEEKQKGRIKGMFGTYVSPDLVSRMVESGEEPQLGGVTMPITAFFSDVQNFSMFSERLSPVELVDLMNEYLTAMTDILQSEGGTLDKYIGDAIVAMFGAPLPLDSHAYRSCSTAIRIQARQALLREKWTAEGDKWPEIVHHMRTRIGLNSGTATVGNMGSRSRFNYTMMGDMVNLAARCESGAKSIGVYTLITEETVKLSREFKDDITFRYLDRWQVKGRSQPVNLYEILGFRKDLSDATLECVRLYEEALQAYFAQDWQRAITGFSAALELEPFHPARNPTVITVPSMVILERSQYFSTHPPGAGWNGVYVMKTK
jgi:adenylate cyclase